MKKQYKQIAISFIVPIFVLLVIYMLWGQYPFGSNTLLIWDMNSQYAPFFSHLHDILNGDASALYTFSRALGGNMLHVASYYLISPFNLIFYFFNEENIYIGILLLALLKTGACGITMYLFLNRRKQEGAAVIFSTAYALCAYVIGYQFNIFWIDALILLPLLGGGIERLTEEGRYLLYAVSLALALITNFYTGYMLCIFSVLYFFCYFFLISDKEYKLKTVITYIWASLAGGLLSACVSLPTLDIMRGGKSEFSLSILKDFKNLFRYRELFDAVFCANISDKQITSGRPLIYCGVFALIMAAYWMIRGKDKIKAKLAYIVLLFALVISFYHYNLNCVWHVFNPPKGSPHRFAFIYVFLFLDMAYKGSVCLMEPAESSGESLRKNAGKRFGKRLGKYTKCDICVILIISLLLCIGLAFRAGDYAEKGKLAILVLNIILIVIYAGAALFIKAPVFTKISAVKRKTAVGLFVLVCTCAELVINAYCLYSVSAQYESVSVQDYQAYIQEMKPLTDWIKDAGEQSSGNAGEQSTLIKQGVWRTAIDRSVRNTSNDPFIFGLYGMDSYTSVEKQNLIQIAGRFGYSNNIMWGMHYNNGSTKAGDAFLGVKYLISGKEMETETEASMCVSGTDTAVYENENVLPFAFLMEDSILAAESFNNTFQYMNELYRSLYVGEDKAGENKEDIFSKPQQELITSSNCVETEYGCLEAADPSKEAYLEYEFKTQVDGIVYTRYDKAAISKAEVFIGNQVIDLSEQRSDVKSIAGLSEGSVFRVRFYFAQNGIISPDKIYVYSENEEVLAAYAKAAGRQEVNVTMRSEAAIDITCTNEDGEIKYLLCTIPYDKGWRLRIDGKRLKENTDVQNFVAIPIEEGRHEIELRFVPPGLYAGTAITLLTAAALTIIHMAGAHMAGASDGAQGILRFTRSLKNGILRK